MPNSLESQSWENHFNVNQMTFEQLRNDVLAWAQDRHLLEKRNAHVQLLKTVEEIGELSGAVLKAKHEEIQDGIGDVLVTVIILSEQLGYNPVKCLQMAYDEIKDRKGSNVNGVFVKEEV